MALMKLIFFVPAEQKEEVKEALFTIGAGRYENYDCCSFETAGTGQFRPLEGSNPFTGNVDDGLETVDEYKVEMVVKKELIKEVLLTLMEVHPYEEPAYETYEILTIDDFQ